MKVFSTGVLLDEALRSRRQGLASAHSSPSGSRTCSNVDLPYPTSNASSVPSEEDSILTCMLDYVMGAARFELGLAVLPRLIPRIATLLATTTSPRYAKALSPRRPWPGAPTRSLCGWRKMMDMAMSFDYDMSMRHETGDESTERRRTPRKTTPC